MGSNKQDLTVCHTRSIEFPVDATSEVTCAQTQKGNVEIRLKMHVKVLISSHSVDQSISQSGQ